MLLNLKKVSQGFIPFDEETVKQFVKLKIDDEIYVEFKPRRNYQFHKKLFSMLNLIFTNQTKYKSVENILTECKFRAGYFEIHISATGEQVYIPKSISFTTMDSNEFEKFYNSAIDTCLMLVPMGKKELEEAILRFC